MSYIYFNVQIERTRDILVSNNIKVHKLTEICLKQNEKLMPVFCKGIDKKILSNEINLSVDKHYPLEVWKLHPKGVIRHYSPKQNDVHFVL